VLYWLCAIPFLYIIEDIELDFWELFERELIELKKRKEMKIAEQKK